MAIEPAPPVVVEVPQPEAEAVVEREPVVEPELETKAVVEAESVVEARPETKTVAEPEPETNVTVEPEPEPVKVEDVERAKQPRGTPIPAAAKPKPPPGLPSDAEMTTRLKRKIKAKCAAEMANTSITVSFFVTKAGAVSLLTATPKNAAGDCAKQQVEGSRFRPRSGEHTPIKIVVE